MRVLDPAGHIDRLVIEAATHSAHTEAALERADAAQQTADRVLAGLIELLVAVGVLKHKD